MSLICVSLTEKTVPDLFTSAVECKSLGADLVEIRLDFLKDLPSLSILKELSELRKTLGLPVIITFRPVWEGGYYEGNEEYRLDVLQEAIKNKFDYVDIEMKTDEKKRERLIANARENKVKTIVSYHNSQTTPPWKEVFTQIKECSNANGDIIKVVYYNSTIQDALNVLKGGSAAKGLVVNFTVMGTGPFGHFTRILAPVIGCRIVYTSLKEGKEAAEGQIDIETLKEIMNILDIIKGQE